MAKSKKKAKKQVVAQGNAAGVANGKIEKPSKKEPGTKRVSPRKLRKDERKRKEEAAAAELRAQGIEVKKQPSEAELKAKQKKKDKALKKQARLEKAAAARKEKAKAKRIKNSTCVPRSSAKSDDPISKTSESTLMEPMISSSSTEMAAKSTDLSAGNSAGDGVTENADYISFDFGDDSADEAPTPMPAENDSPNVFSKVAAKLGAFVQNSINPLKRKRGSNRDKTQARRETQPAVDPYPWLRNVSYEREQEPSRILHREILDFVEYIAPSEKEHLIRTFVVSRVKKLVERRWPTATLRVFGSFETKLYLPTSDIDLVILSQANGELYEKPGHLRKLANWLVKAKIAEDIQVITSARVPIIKFVDTITKINVDISFNKPGGIVAAEVVKGYMQTMPALRPMVIFIKHFLNMRGMNEVYMGGLGSYSIICMVISFLQLHPKISSGQILPQDNLGVLVVEFFELYGKRFNYDNVGISINSHGQYFNKLDYGWQRPGQTYLLSIEDPTDTDNDIAKSSFGILKVKSTFGGGHDFLIQRLYDVNDRFKERRRGYGDEDSILSAVVSIDEDMKESRRFIVDALENKSVQDELARMDESEGEIREGDVTIESLGSAHTTFIEEHESDDELIDNDGLKFTKPAGYAKPSVPADADDLYKRLAHGATDSNDDQHVYLIASDDEVPVKRSEVIDLASSDEERDSKTAQVGKSARLRYWDAKGKEKHADAVLSDGELT